MKNIKLIFIPFIIVILNGVSVLAEDRSSTKPFSLDECIDLARSRNNQYLNSKFIEEAKKSFLQREHASLHTKLNLSISGSKEAFLREPISPGDIFSNLRNVWTISHTLFTNRNIRKSLIEASLDYDNSIKQSNFKLNEVTFLVKQAYWRLVVLSKLQSLERQRLKYLNKICEIENDRMVLGLASVLEVKSADLQKEIAESDVLKINNELASNTIIFKNFIGEKTTEDIKLVDSLPIPDESYSFEALSLEGLSIDNVLPIKIFQNEITRYKARVKYAAKTYWPRIKFIIGKSDNIGNFYSAGFDNDWNLSLSSSRPFRQAILSTTESNFVGFSVAYDLSDGGYSAKSVDYEKNILESAYTQLASLKEYITSKIIQDINNIRNLKRAFEIILDNKSLGFKNIEMAELKYRSGDYNLKKVIEAYLDYVDIEKKYLETLYDYNIAVEQFKFDTMEHEYKEISWEKS